MSKVKTLRQKPGHGIPRFFGAVLALARKLCLAEDVCIQILLFISIVTLSNSTDGRDLRKNKLATPTAAFQAGVQTHIFFYEVDRFKTPNVKRDKY